jgi:hypothetical protein
MDKFKKGDKVFIITYNPPQEAIVADTYELPFEQVPMNDQKMINKYYGKTVPIVEVFINGKIRSFVDEVVKKS